VEGRIGAVLKAAVITLVAWFAVGRFMAWIPLSFIAHETAPLPNALQEPIQGERSGEAFSETRRGRSFRLLPRASYDVAARVASTERIASVLGLVHRGDVVRLEGDLVDVDGPGGFVWRTSLTRTDTGPGACETLYVRAITIGTRRYR
jgi:hypothetical protein